MSGGPVIPSQVDPVVRQASTLVGGPVGRHARVGAHPFWTPLRVLLALTMLTFGLGWLQKLPCHGGNYGEGNRHAYTRLCYTDVHALWFAEGLNEGKTPYIDHPVEYPVLIGGIMELATFAADSATEFYDRTSVLLLVSALVVTGTSVALAGRRRRWDAALVALAPGLLLHGTTNWDLPAAALAGLGLWQWARGRPTVSGLLLGLAVATKLYPAIFFVPLFVLCLRAHRLGAWAKCVSAALAVYAVLNVWVYSIAGDFVYGDPGKSLPLFGDSDEPRNSVGRFFVLNSERGADWDSIWFMIQEVMRDITGNRGWTFPVSSASGDFFSLNRMVAGTFLLCLVAIGVLIWRAPRRPRLGQVLFLTLAAFLLTNKVNSPQYTIWLIPLAVMARPRWGAFLTWQVLELGVMFTRFYMFVQFSKAERGLPVDAFLVAIAARDIALIVLMGLVVREILRPQYDVVREGGVDDPAGGVLNDTPDIVGAKRSPVRAGALPGLAAEATSRRGWTLPLSPSFSWRSLAGLAGASVLIAVVMSWPLATHLGRDIPQDLGDPLLQAWQIDWGGHALLHQPLKLFQSNTFYPLRDSLAFSDALLGYAPVGALFGGGAVGALTAYNVLFLFAYALAFAAAFLLARELGTTATAAAVAGAAFAYAPFRLGQNGHLHVISSGGIPLTLFLLLRGYRRGSPRLVVAGWLVAAWQVSIGFTLGLQLAYLLAGLAVAAVAVWFRRGRPGLPRRLVVASAVGMLVFAGLGILQARPYLRVQERHPESVRQLAEVEFFSPPAKGFLVAPPESRVWANPTKEERAALPWAAEQALFPGLAVLTLAGIGLSRNTFSVRLRIALAGTVVVTAVFAMGLRFFGGRLTYRLLYDYFPGWQGVRTPGRLVTLTTLALAMLAAAGVHRLGEPRTGRRGDGAGALPPVATWVGLTLAAVVLIEGSGALPHPTAPMPPAALREVAGPRLHLPTDEGGDLRYMFWSTDGLPEVVNGTSGFVPAQLRELRDSVRGFPDAGSVERLRDIGVRHVVLHPDRAGGTPWEQSAGRPVEGLGITREERGGLVIFGLG